MVVQKVFSEIEDKLKVGKFGKATDRSTLLSYCAHFTAGPNPYCKLPKRNSISALLLGTTRNTRLDITLHPSLAHPEKGTNRPTPDPARFRVVHHHMVDWKAWDP